MPDYISYRVTTAEPLMGLGYHRPTQYKLEQMDLDCYFDNSRLIGDYQIPVQCHPMAEKNAPQQG